ncbi:MAG: hypothetical protein M0P61_03065 [Ignavibacteriaceae bacterium]|jgi:hypothetical protein|nr:hypothetical protein [Ignavibacteriaceae bacterium]
MKTITLKNIIYFVIFFAINSFSQPQIEKREGVVTYQTPQNVYVKFVSTENIIVNDTLFIFRSNALIPAIQVKFLSSKSVAGERINNVSLNENEPVFAFVKGVEKKEEKLPGGEKLDSISTIAGIKIPKKVSTPKNYYGRFSMQSVSQFDNVSNRGDMQRWRYSLSFSADKIADSKFSFSSYINFSYNVKDWPQVKKSIGQSLKIYDLGVSYELSTKSLLWIGRHLNPRTANVGTIDGVQYEYTFSKYYTGAILGSRPNFSDYGYNAKLFQFGGYVGRTDSLKSSTMENTIAVFNQTNNFKTDRRYLYLQHSNDIIPKTYFFASSEVDMFKKVNLVGKNTLSLTSIFFSVRYSPIQLISASLSYDARKNVIYYETYKTLLEYLIENEMRQGYSASVYIKPFSQLYISANAGYRFQKRDAKPSRNFGSTISYYQIPYAKVDGSISFLKLISSYSEGAQVSLRTSKSFWNDNISLAGEIRDIKYHFVNNPNAMHQLIAGLEMSIRIPFNMYASLSYEGIFEKKNTQGRVFLDLTKRF